MLGIKKNQYLYEGLHSKCVMQMVTFPKGLQYAELPKFI